MNTLMLKLKKSEVSMKTNPENYLSSSGDPVWDYGLKLLRQRR